MSYKYGNHFPPIHQYYVAGPTTALSTTATEVTEGGVYLLNSGNVVIYVRITDATDNTTPTADNGFTLAVNSNMTVYIKTGQYIHASDPGEDDSGCYTLLKPY